jgi:hypothetical protein
VRGSSSCPGVTVAPNDAAPDGHRQRIAVVLGGRRGTHGIPGPDAGRGRGSASLPGLRSAGVRVLRRADAGHPVPARKRGERHRRDPAHGDRAGHGTASAPGTLSGDRGVRADAGDLAGGRRAHRACGTGPDDVGVPGGSGPCVPARHVDGRQRCVVPGLPSSGSLRGGGHHLWVHPRASRWPVSGPRARGGGPVRDRGGARAGSSALAGARRCGHGGSGGGNTQHGRGPGVDRGGRPLHRDSRGRAQLPAWLFRQRKDPGEASSRAKETE